MGILDTLLGRDAANASRAAAADTYAKQNAATGKIVDYGNDYLTNLLGLSKGFDPYVQAGGVAANQYTNLLRDPSSVRSLPGYEFMRDEGLRGVDHSAAARGNVFSGKTGKDLTRFAENYADTSYGNQLQRLMQGTQLGQGAVAGQAGVAGQGYQGQLATRQSAYGGDMNAAGTIGQGNIAAANAQQGALQNLFNSGIYLAGQWLGGGKGLPFGGGK